MSEIPEAPSGTTIDDVVGTNASRDVYDRFMGRRHKLGALTLTSSEFRTFRKAQLELHEKFKNDPDPVRGRLQQQQINVLYALQHGDARIVMEHGQTPPASSQFLSSVGVDQLLQPPFADEPPSGYAVFGNKLLVKTEHVGAFIGAQTVFAVQDPTQAHSLLVKLMYDPNEMRDARYPEGTAASARMLDERACADRWTDGPLPGARMNWRRRLQRPRRSKETHESTSTQSTR